MADWEHSLRDLVDKKSSWTDLVSQLEHASTHEGSDIAIARRLLLNAAELYGQMVELSESGMIEVGSFDASPSLELRATEAMIASSELLAASNLNVFELGVWFEARRPSYGDE